MYTLIKRSVASWSGPGLLNENPKCHILQNIGGIKISTDSESFTSQDRKVFLSFDLKWISKMVCQVEGCDLWSLSFCMSEFQSEIQQFTTPGLLERPIQVHIHSTKT